MKYVMIIKHVRTELLVHLFNLAFNCAKWISTNCSARIQWPVTGTAVGLLQRFSLHPQLHLRIASENLRVPLAKQSCHLLIGYAPRTEASGIHGSQVANPKIRKLCSSERLLPNGLQLCLVAGRIQIAGKLKRSTFRNCQLVSECRNGKGERFFDYHEPGSSSLDPKLAL
jgi:hypothetical protein